jgi:hypothetical protein
MLTKLTLLVAVAQAVVTPGKTLGGTISAPTKYTDAWTVSTTTTAADYRLNGYACIRRGWAFSYPMVVGSGAVTVGTTQSTTINAFFPTTVAQLGTSTATPAAGDNTGCGTAINAIAANPVLVDATNAPSTNRLFWFTANWATSSGAGTDKVNWINVDFALASTYQDSFSGTGTRGTAPVNYCDVQITALDATTTMKDLVTVQGLTGLTKCTYFINVAADKGAPAFTITNLDFWAFQLHYAEWSGEDMASKFLTTNLYVGTIAAAAANIYPIPIKGTYPAGGTAITTLNWPVAV